MARFKALKNITHAIDNITEIGKEVAIDKDKMLELDHDLQKVRAELLLGGVAPITKTTICVLVSAIVLTGLAKFWITPGDMVHFWDFARSITPLIGTLIGTFGFGKAFKNSKWSNNK